MNLKVGWKVFYLTKENELWPAANGNQVYQIGKSNKPQVDHGPITVFKKLENAKRFMNVLLGTFRVKKVLYRPSKYREVWNLWKRVTLEDLIIHYKHIGVTADAVDLASVVYVLDEV